MKNISSEPPDEKETVLQKEFASPHSRRGVVIALTVGGLAVGTGLAGTAWWFFTQRTQSATQRPFITATPFPIATPTPTDTIPTTPGLSELTNENGTKTALPDDQRFREADGSNPRPSQAIGEITGDITTYNPQITGMVNGYFLGQVNVHYDTG